MKLATTLPGIIFLFAYSCSEEVVAAPDPKSNGGAGHDSNDLNLSVQSDSGKQYDLKLTKADASGVLHPDVQVFSVSTHEESGKLQFESWAPTQEDLEHAENVYVDQDNLAAVRLAFEDGNRVIEGVVDGMKFEEKNGEVTLYPKPVQNRTDYADIGRELTRNATNRNLDCPVNAIVETVLICDKEFGDIFQHDKQRILEYFTVYFWDLNLRYRTLPSNNIQFRINGIVVISSTSEQPFIEEARAVDGRADFHRILPKLPSWVYEHMDSLPKFDIAIAVTNTQLEWTGGKAYVKAACFVDHRNRKHMGSVVFSDDGSWGTAIVGAHEIGHVLGAPHDDDPNYPCEDRGYIMMANGQYKDDVFWFFSRCSDRYIGEFVRSNQAACLRTLDEVAGPLVDPNFSEVLALPMVEQCRRKLKNDKVYVVEEDTANCTRIKCRAPHPTGNAGWYSWWSFQPVENTPCIDGGRCFHGRCRKIGSLIKNVGSGLCMRATNPFSHNAMLDMVECPNPGTPLDRFVITEDNLGKTLATPFQSADAKENSDKCVFTGKAEGDTLLTDRCSTENSSLRWDFIDTGNGEFLMSHRATKRCASASGSSISTSANCDRNDRNMLWTLE